MNTNIAHGYKTQGVDTMLTVDSDTAILKT